MSVVFIWKTNTWKPNFNPQTVFEMLVVNVNHWSSIWSLLEEFVAVKDNLESKVMGSI